MDREIRFRLWDKATEKMVEGASLVDLLDNAYGVGNFDGGNGHQANISQYHNVVFMQYTGLEDKNGTPIMKAILLK